MIKRLIGNVHRDKLNEQSGGGGGGYLRLRLTKKLKINFFY